MPVMVVLGSKWLHRATIFVNRDEARRSAEQNCPWVNEVATLFFSAMFHAVPFGVERRK
jgi:hypothetical protein